MRLVLTVVVMCACYTPPAAMRAAKARQPTVADALEKYIEATFKKDQFEGVVVVDRGGAVTYQRAIGLADRSWGLRHTLDGRFDIGAVTRSFTAALVTVLAKEGKVDLDAPLAAYLPDVRGPAGKVTIRHLLTDTAGYPRRGIAYAHDDAYALRKLSAHLSGLTLSSAPGMGRAPSELGALTLAAVVDEVTGSSWEEELHARLLKPLKLTCTGVETPGAIIPRHVRGYARAPDLTPGAWVEAPGVPSKVRGASTMYSCAGDLVRWARAMAHPEELFGAPLATAFRQRTITDEGFAWTFRTLALDGDATVDAEGITSRTPGSHVAVWHFPASDTTVVLLGNSGAFPVGEVADGVVSVLNGRSGALPRADLGLALAGKLRQGPAAVAALLEAWRGNPAAYALDEEALNTAGYESLSRGRTADALAFFRVQVEAFPNSTTAHDSLGEALLATGDPDGARAHYRRALELDPGNDNARKVLASLGDR